LIKKNKTTKALLLLFIVFVVGFAGQAILNYSFSLFTKELDRKIASAQFENRLGQTIIHEIYEIKSYFFQLSSFPNKHYRRIIINSINKDQQEVIRALEILNEGGSYREIIELNLAHTEELIETVHFMPSHFHRFTFVQADMLAKFSSINRKAQRISQLIEEIEVLKLEQPERLGPKMDQMKLELKLTAPIFDRLKQNSNEVFYENKKTALRLERLTAEKKAYYRNLQVSLTLVVLMIGLFIFWILSQRITKTQDQMALANDYTKDILESQSNIIVVNDGQKIIDVSGGFFTFFDDYDSIPAFAQNYQCVCDLFLKEPGYIFDFQDKFWVEFVIDHPETIHKAKLIYKNQLYIFQITAVKSKKYQRYIISMFDITENEQINHDLQVQKNKALEATQAKGEFLANMSHEIRTPMNAILGFIGLLKDREHDALSAQYLETIDSSSQSLLGIINDILDFSKIENGKLELDPINFDPTKEFMITADLFKAKSSEKNLNFKVDIQKDLPAQFNADVLRLKQIISNLLSNAIKFTESYHCVEFTVRFDTDQKTLHISVRDQGIGISPEQQENIFDAFTQAEASITRKFGGTGLGLAISSRLVNMLGGELKLESELGKGSCFAFSIPVNIVQGQLSEVIEDREIKKTGYILLVEDNKTNQLLMKAILSKLGMRFDIANDGLEAIEAVKNTQYDLILMDENMPNLNGIEATAQIRLWMQQTRQPSLPIIALTANAMTGDRERFLSAGMDEYLTKPVDLSALIGILNRFL